METQNEAELDLIGLLLHLKRKLWLILVVTVIAALIGYVGAKMLTTPQYTASTQVWVYQQDQEYVDYNNLVVASQMRKDCIEIIKSEKVTEEVIKRLGLNMSPKYLGRAIRVETEDNTRFLQVSYTCGNPQEAADVVNTAIDVAADVTKELLKTDVLLPLFEATKPQAETTTNIRKSTWTAAGVGAAAMTALLVIFFLLDDTIRTEDDVQSHLGLSTLAIIPLSNELHVNRGSRNGARGKLQGQKPKWR